VNVAELVRNVPAGDVSSRYVFHVPVFVTSDPSAAKVWRARRLVVVAEMIDAVHVYVVPPGDFTLTETSVTAVMSGSASELAAVQSSA